MRIWHGFGTVALALAASVAPAQPLTGGAFSIAQSTIDGGGGQSSGGEFSLVGTIAQADAAELSSGGGFSIRGGFWYSIRSALIVDTLFADGFEDLP